MSALTGWEPIETAPDAVCILYHPPVWREGRGQTHSEWITVDRPGMYPRKATHWMPLPPAPVQS